MCHNPAILFDVEKRGFIREGFYADLVIFNPDTIIDKASYKSPKLHSEGIESVFVNGKVVWENDGATNNRPGMFLPGKNFIN